MKYKEWIARIRSRSDITAYCTHLTRNATIEGKNFEAIDVLLRILRMRKLVGSTTSTGYIVGTTPAVCFFDAPLYSIIQNLHHEATAKDIGRFKYSAYGVGFPKSYLFRSGGRPAVYDRTEDAKKYLPKEQYWRIVNFDLSNDEYLIDWTHEREWRVPKQLEFDIKHAVVHVPNGIAQQEFFQRSASGGEDVAKLVKAVVPLNLVFL